jgi:hypothetical protein
MGRGVRCVRTQWGLCFGLIFGRLIFLFLFLIGLLLVGNGCVGGSELRSHTAVSE